MNILVQYPRAIKFQLFVIIFMGIIGGALAFPISYLSSSNFLLGLALFPFSFFVEGRQRVNYFYLIIILGFAFLSGIYHVRFFYFISIAFFIVFVCEWFLGKVNPIIIVLIMTMSPVFHQVAVIFGFPIRLWLSECAAFVLRNAGWNVFAEGNTMVLDGAGFSIDEACMGLNMLAVSMFIGIYLLIHQYHVAKKKLSLFLLALYFVAVISLNVLANICRIILLVIFKVLPANPLHEVIGIACLVVYVIVPLFFISKLATAKFGITLEQSQVVTAKKSHWALVIVAMSIMSLGFVLHEVRKETAIPYTDVSFGNSTGLKLKHGVTQFSEQDALIYIKTIPDFFSGEHTPLICWRGSGYEFKAIKPGIVNGKQIYLATLEKGDERLYTAWWYTNGRISTIEQMEWRAAMLKKKGHFSLVNVTASSETILHEKLTDIFNNNRLKFY